MNQTQIDFGIWHNIDLLTNLAVLLDMLWLLWAMLSYYRAAGMLSGGVFGLGQFSWDFYD